MPRSSSTTGPTWATRWSCTTDTRCAVLISCRAAPTTTEHRGRAGTEGFRPALLRLCLCLCLWLRWCSGRRRARPPARLGVLTSFGAAPRSPPVPSGPSGALHTGGACVSGVPVGCGPPARLGVLTSFGASSRSPARPRRSQAPPPTVAAARPPLPPAPSTPAVPVVLVCLARPCRRHSPISHVIPLRLFQILNAPRWNCNVFSVC